jgi:hypothetical protein
MKLTRAVSASALAAGIGLAGLLGVGLASASAEPDCNAPGRPPCDQHHDDWHPGDDHGDFRGGPVDWHNRGIDQGRGDHQPFNWNGQQVTPVPAGNGGGWGFWFLGTWIPL